MTDHYLFVDSSVAVVTLNPEYGYEAGKVKNQMRKRSVTGKEYSYTLGTYEEFEVPVEYVSSADRYQIEQWWEDNDAMYWLEEGGTAVQVRITNDEFPLRKRNKPYYDYFKGTIKLSTYL